MLHKTSRLLFIIRLWVSFINLISFYWKFNETFANIPPKFHTNKKAQLTQKKHKIVSKNLNLETSHLPHITEFMNVALQ